MSICFWFMKRNPILFCNYSGRTGKNSQNFIKVLVQKETFNDLQLKPYISFRKSYLKIWWGRRRSTAQLYSLNYLKHII